MGTSRVHHALKVARSGFTEGTHAIRNNRRSSGTAATVSPMAKKAKPALKNKSEILFEAYLRSQGYTDCAFEPEIQGTSRRPDYRLSWSGQDILVEVKEFRAEADDFGRGFGFFDPYPPLREKIDAARVKFKGLKQYCCCLVLYNRDKPLVRLDWRHVYGAMLGSLGFSVPIHVPERPAPEDDAINSIFMSGGKLHREHQGVAVAPQNQTISAVLVLGRVPVGNRLFHADLREREVRQGRKFALEERLRELEASQGTARDARRWPLRVVVHENPYARVLLPAELFRGPHDERYGGRDGRIQRLFQGDEIARLPKAMD